MLAKSAILRSVAEHRMVEANKSRPQQVDEAKLTTGSQVDKYRAPDRKDVPEWKRARRTAEARQGDWRRHDHISRTSFPRAYAPYKATHWPYPRTPDGHASILRETLFGARAYTGGEYPSCLATTEGHR